MDTKQVVFEPTEVIFNIFAPGDYMYFICEGEAQVEIPAASEDGTVLAVRVVATLCPGAPVGEMALVLPDGLRTATVRAKTKVVAEMVTRDEFEAMLAATSPKFQEYTRAIAQELADVTQGRPASAVAEKLSDDAFASLVEPVSPMLREVAIAFRKRLADTTKQAARA